MFPRCAGMHFVAWTFPGQRAQEGTDRGVSETITVETFWRFLTHFGMIIYTYSTKCDSHIWPCVVKYDSRSGPVWMIWPVFSTWECLKWRMSSNWKRAHMCAFFFKADSNYACLLRTRWWTLPSLSASSRFYIRPLLLDRSTAAVQICCCEASSNSDQRAKVIYWDVLWPSCRVFRAERR